VSKSGLLVFLVFFAGLSAQAEDSTETVTMGGTVSVEELRNPLEGKALRMILAAQKDLRSGHHDRGMEELRQALADPRAMPYALSMLGSEHLKAGAADVALPELEDAVRLLPGHPENHSNLAYALGVAGNYPRALTEARKALQLNPSEMKTRFVLGMILLLSGREDEGVAHLKVAAENIAGARSLLAVYLERKSHLEAVRTEESSPGTPIEGAPNEQIVVYAWGAREIDLTTILTMRIR